MGLCCWVVLFSLSRSVSAECSSDEGTCFETHDYSALSVSLLSHKMWKPLGKLQDNSRNIIYGHMSKTAGTLINKVLRQTVSSELVAFNKEALGLDDAQRLNFVIGSMRNPCEFYVSLWAFQSKRLAEHGHTGIMADMQRRFPSDFERLVGLDIADDFSSVDDVSRFREWLRYLSNGNGTLGLMTARFYKKYVELAEHHTQNLRDAADLASSMTVEEVAKVQESMSVDNVRGLNICWVLVDTLSFDLTNCLSAYNKLTSGVDLDAINTSYTANPSQHAPCHHYYDEETSNMVLKMDKELFKLFGYGTCCSQPRSERPKTFVANSVSSSFSEAAEMHGTTNQMEPLKTIHDFLRPTTHCTSYLAEHAVHFPPSVPDSRGLRQNIEHVNVAELTPESFRERYVLPNKPVILAGASSNLFDNSSDAFSLEGIKSNQFSNLKQTVTHEAGRIVSHGVERLNVHELFGHPNRTVLFEKHDFDELTEDVAMGSSAQLQQDYFLRMKDSNVLQRTSAKSTRGTFNLHLSNQGGALPHHHGQTINAIFHGAKRWIFVDPSTFIGENLQLRFEMQDFQPVGSSDPYTSHQWFRDAVLDMEVPYYDFVLEEGDAVFIPSDFTHATIDLCKETVGAVLMKDVVGTREHYW